MLRGYSMEFIMNIRVLFLYVFTYSESLVFLEDLNNNLNVTNRNSKKIKKHWYAYNNSKFYFSRQCKYLVLDRCSICT